MSLRSLGKHTRRRMMSEMNVVPYIDVMLVLVVILMVAAPFVNPSVVNHPSVQKASKAPDKPVEVIVHTDGKISVRAGKSLVPVTIGTLVERVKSQGSLQTTPVVIAADKDVNYGKVIDVMKMLQKANVARVGLALQLENSKR